MINIINPKFLFPMNLGKSSDVELDGRQQEFVWTYLTSGLVQDLVEL